MSLFKLNILVALLAVGFLGASQVGCDSSSVPSGDVMESREGHAVDGAMPVMVQLYSPYCAACKEMKPLVKNLTEQCDDRGVKMEAVDVSAEENQSLLDHYRVRAVPTFLFLDEYGVETARLVGRQSEQSLKQALSVLSGQECPGVSMIDRDGDLIIGG